MSEKTMTVRHPPVGPSRETFTRAGALLQSSSADGRHQLVVWCRQTLAGAVYHVDLGMWSITAPITLEAFVQSLSDRGYVLPDGPDRQTWFDVVSGVKDAQH